ncbi:MAG: serine/threonine protein kinase, partial [Massilia sp.]|nr:serine/threonine protein kinase [Massilia sp.]
MDAAVVVCQHCGAPLPRQARWRAVTCAYCGALNAAPVTAVDAKRFRQAWQRAHAADADADATNSITCAGQVYRVLAPLATGENARILLAERRGATAERVVLKVAFDGAPAGRLLREYQVLGALQNPDVPGAAYFSQRLQQPVALGGDTLALRVPAGFWGSLDAVQANYPGGIDARHAVWMWRRILEVLGFAHAAGWAHGRLYPAHLLVQPRDHGILIIGWAGAVQPGPAAGGAAFAR